MQINLQALAVAVLYCLHFVLAEVTVLKQVQTIYDRTPKIRIRGSGFEAEEADTKIDVGAIGQKSLVLNTDFTLSKDPDGDGIILKLTEDRTWVSLAGRTPPVALVLNSVMFGTSKVNLLVEPVIIAQVMPTPSVVADSDVLYQSASNELRINGTGFIGAKFVNLYFQPPLVKAVAYEDVTPYPLTKNEVVLRLRHGYSWREEVGELRVIGVDTGGGPVKVDGDEGAVVADVESNLDMHSVTVTDTASSQLVYDEDPLITVYGSGFNTIGNALRWSNNLLGNNVNYSTLSTADSAISLHLSPGSLWRANPENLPGTLTLLAVNAGGGYVAVGPMNAGKGRDVAMIFERPDVDASAFKLFRTHSHEVHLTGTGFPPATSGFRPQLRFHPQLDEDDYTVIVVSRTEIEITIVDGAAWRSEPGPLQVTAINTRGDEGGWVSLPGSGTKVADIVADIVEGGVEVIPTGVKVYQSALSQSIAISGTGFKAGMKFTFEPALSQNDYSLEVVSKNSAVLRLKSGKKWRKDMGLLVAQSVEINGGSSNLAGTEGIRVAVVLADPSLTASTMNYHESQSKLIVIEGAGFTNVADLKIMIRPSSPAAYTVIGVMDDAIRVQLVPGNAWLPSFASLKDEEEGKNVPLQVASIDTGAGVITFADPITVGNIVKDREGVTCDDSCEFAFDGVCDDGSEPFDEYYYENYFNYADDDMGGFYGGLEYDDYRRKLSPTETQNTHTQKNKAQRLSTLSTQEESSRHLQEYYDDWEGGGGHYYDWEDDYYMDNNDYQVSACVQGTDCTDCGGVDAIIDYSKPLEGDTYVECTNTCTYSRDGICDDPRGTAYCMIGTDCQDCGPVGSNNFTTTDDDNWWDDDDDYWNFNDGNFLEQTDGLESNRHKVKLYRGSEEESAGSLFLIVLEAMVYTVGAIFFAAALYLLSRWYRGEAVPFVGSFNAELSESEFEMQAQQRMPVTPDSFRT
ncbi:hypothetical protein B484DRAFT_450036 [Ochromonadaceae sp. CCMP2298]|nr:hypothetical protein B484DRAFT_450036 [Ochromonadaceae sp. CCMP2298]